MSSGAKESIFIIKLILNVILIVIVINGSEEIKQFLHILRNKDHDEDISGWQGRIEQITNNIKKTVEKLFKSEMAKLKKEESHKHEVTRKATELKLESLNKKMAIMDEKMDAIMQNFHPVTNE